MPPASGLGSPTPFNCMVEVNPQADRMLATSAHVRCLTDAGLLMGRSFRVGWSPNGVHIRPGTLAWFLTFLSLLLTFFHQLPWFEKWLVLPIVDNDSRPPFQSYGEVKCTQMTFLQNIRY